MLFFKEKKADRNIIIIGCGRLGSKIANTLSDKGESVLVIDKNRDSYRRLSPGFGGLTIVGDCTDLSTLEEAQIQNASVVVAVTNDDSTNIMVSQLAKNIYHTEHVIARLYDPERSCSCEGIDIDIICPASLSAREIDNILDTSDK